MLSSYRMRKTTLLLILFLIFIAGCSRKKENIQLPLSEEKIEEALKYGKENASLSLTEFTEPWTVDLGYELWKGRATLITPFLRVALIGRKAVKLGKEPDYNVIKVALKDETDKLHFRVSLYGDRPTFGRGVDFILKFDSKEIKPIHKFMPLYSQFTRDYYNVVTGEVKFSKNGIPEDGVVKLIAIFPPEKDEKERKRCEFTFDLKKYR